MSKLKIDLGCGSRKKDGWFGIDMVDGPEVDLVMDITQGLPLSDNSVSKVYSYHMLEHLDRTHYANLFAELHRVCEPGATLDIWVPYWTHRTAYNFSHLTRINEHCFEGPGFQQFFEVLAVTYVFEDDWRDKLPEEKEYARKHLMNVVKEMRVECRTRKEE